MSYSRDHLHIRAALLLALIVINCTRGMVYAHGGDMHTVLNGVPIGPYTLTASVSPAALRPGEVHVAVTITDDGVPVVNCNVWVNMTPLDLQQEPIRVRAGPAKAATNYQHEALVHLPVDGRYSMDITVRDPAGRGGSRQIEIFVRPVSLWMNLLIYVQLALAPIIGLWLLREGHTLWKRLRKSRS